MISVVYLGKNPQTEERLKYIPGRLVKVAKTYREAASICLPRLHNEHFILLYEKGIRNEDITAISYITKKCKTIYIILNKRKTSFLLSISIDYWLSSL